jgi:antirestriction protein ArdC
MNEQINKKTQTAYEGYNQYFLQIAKDNNGFKSNEWLTFLQAKELNLKIKKGSHGVRLMKVYEDEKETKDGKKTVGARHVMGFTVFNADQTEKIVCSVCGDEQHTALNCPEKCHIENKAIA